jgi:hypothetical protein
MSGNSESRGFAIVVWLVAAVVGTMAIWRLSLYIESLTALAQTDRAAASELFQSRVLPVLWGVAVLSLGAGAYLARHGLQMLRSGQLSGSSDAPATIAGASGARGIGFVLVAAGVLMAITPLTAVAVMTYALR